MESNESITNEAIPATPKPKSLRDTLYAFSQAQGDVDHSRKRLDEAEEELESIKEAIVDAILASNVLPNGDLDDCDHYRLSAYMAGGECVLDVRVYDNGRREVRVIPLIDADEIALAPNGARS